MYLEMTGELKMILPWTTIPKESSKASSLSWSFSDFGKVRASLIAQLVKSLPVIQDSIPGLGRSTAEGIGNPLQYSWASLVAQTVKNLPAMWETWIRSQGWEEPLEKGKAIQSSILT